MTKRSDTCDGWDILLHAYSDGEMRPEDVPALEQHLVQCAGCAEELADIQRLRRLASQPDVTWRAPDDLKRRILDSIVGESRQNRQYMKMPTRLIDVIRRWSFLPSFAALAASLWLFYSAPSSELALQDQIVASHVRSLLANHLVDVPTSNQHTIRPWFNGKLDFAPPVSDLAAEGFPLVGARMDYIDNRVVAALVYRRHGHVLNLFIWNGHEAASRAASHTGYNFASWTTDGLVFWVVSDIAASDLQRFEALLRERRGE